MAKSDDAPKFSLADFYLLPLRIHLFKGDRHPEVATTLEQADIARILGKANKVWSQAGIAFYVESIQREEPERTDRFLETKMAATNPAILDLRPEKSRGTNCFNVYYVKKLDVNGVYHKQGIFVKDTAALRPVEGGIDEPIPRVTSHEIGHALGLEHRQNNTNLMASGTTGTWLNGAEVEKARRTAGGLEWASRAGKVLEEADGLYATGKQREARELYRKLAAARIEANGLERVVARAKED